MRQHDNDGEFISEIAEELKTKPSSYEPPRSTKRISWVRLALLLIVVGAAMTGVGWIMGARGANVTWNNGIQLHAVRHNSLHTQQSVAMTPFSVPFSDVRVDTMSARVEVVRSDTYAVEVIWYGERGFLIDPHNVQNGVLVIDTREAERNNQGMNISLGFGQINTGSNVIRIHAPSVDYLRLRSVSGRIFVEDIAWTHLSAESISGRVEVFNNPQIAEDIHVLCVSGRVHIQGVEWRNMYATSVSGRIEVYGTPHGDTTLNTTTGRIDMEVIGRGYGEFSYNLTSSTGRVEIDGNRITSNNGGRRTLSRNIGEGNPTILASTTSGRIEVNFSPREHLR